MEASEEPLSGGNLNGSIVRVGSTVRRESGPWTPAVHSLLDHLEGVGYPAPRARGFDEKGREILTYVHGVAVHPDHHDLTADLGGLARAASLIADYHEAQATFVRPPTAEWRDNGRDPSGSEEVLAHNDLAPWNLIAGPEWTYIDWDLLAPGRRHWDLAWALHSFVGLWPDGHPDDLAVRRIITFCDGARVPAIERPTLLRTVVERTAHSASELHRRSEEGDAAYQRMVDEGHADVWQAGSDHVARSLEQWLALMDEVG